ncbi:MAG: hypothetical protein QOH46_2515, partial [Solirubrobacteraceae bacterium]|nr:hypothetical protein [Solirubrobacteraceae bacterium]
MSTARTEPSAPATAGAHGRGLDVRDVLEGVALVAAATIVWVAASALPPAPIEGEMASSVWPKALAVALGALGVALVVEAIRGRVADAEGLDPVNPAQWPVLAATLGLLVAFLLAWQAIGFLPAAIVSFVLISRLVGVGDWLRAAAWGT